MSDNPKPPPVLYRYISWANEYHRPLLTDNQVYFTAAKEFNDPFDCRIRIDVSAKAKEIRRYFENRENWPPEFGKLTTGERERFITKRVTQLSSEQGRKKLKEDFRRNMNEGHGILSLTERPDSLLMWAHYANCHKGLCIGLDTELLEWSLYDVFSRHKATSELRKVHYSDDYPAIDLFTAGYTPGDYAKFLDRKSLEWSYEEEWRMILGVKPGLPRAQRLREGVIKEVILGCRVVPKDELEIRGIVGERQKQAKVFQTRPCEDRFALELLETAGGFD